MYYGRLGAFLTGECAAVAVGAARGALDLYEEILRTKKMTLFPTVELSKDPEFLHHYGKALTKVVTAETALIQAGEDFMTYAREDAAGTAPFDDEREQRIALIEQQCIRLAWEAVELIFRTVGTSHAAKAAQPIGRILRNLAVINTHPALQSTASRSALRARASACRLPSCRAAVLPDIRADRRGS